MAMSLLPFAALSWAFLLWHVIFTTICVLYIYRIYYTVCLVKWYLFQIGKYTLHCEYLKIPNKIVRYYD